MSKALESAESRDERKKNLIIHNFPEGESTDPAESEMHDRTAVRTLMNEHLKVTCKSPVKITRLGAANNNKKRPMKVCMDTETDKIKILTNANKLKFAPEPYKSARVASDMTEEERNQNRKLLAEARRLNTQESGNWINLVRGPPWNRHIMRVPKRN